MGHAMESVDECAILKTHPVLQFKTGKYAYRIERQGSQSIYSVTDGVQTFTVPIGWAFGLGRAGQTYVFEKDGRFYESRVSFYKEIDGSDLTMGAINQAPLNLLQAAGREMGKQDGARCFHVPFHKRRGGLEFEFDRPCSRCSMRALPRLGRRSCGRLQDGPDRGNEEINRWHGRANERILRRVSPDLGRNRDRP